MDLDYSTWAWYTFQWIISLYIYTLFKENDYNIDTSLKLPDDFKEFRRNILIFKKKCVDKYWNDLSAKLEIMLEWEWKCFEDINLLSINSSWNSDNLIFIQVKTKWWNKTITKNDGVLKSIKNFIQNLNFQKDKEKNNVLFFILSNTKLSQTLLNEISTHNVNFYISMIDYIISDNNTRTTTKNLLYPNKPLNNIWLNSELTSDLIIKLKDNNISDIDLSKYLNLYDINYIHKLYKIIKDLKVILNNLVLIRSLKIDLLKSELINYYGRSWEWGYLDKKDIIESLSTDITEIHKSDELFNRYKKFMYTYFSKEDNGKFIYELDSISKWKFI